MSRIDKSIKVITYDTYLNFKWTLDNKSADSIFRAFREADKYDEEGNVAKFGDHKLTGKEIAAFLNAIGEELKQKFFTKLENDKIANCLRYSNDELEVNEYDKQKYDKAIKSLNVNNIESIIFDTHGNDKARDFVHQLEQPIFHNNSNPRSIEEIDSACKRVRKVLQQWCKKHHIDTSKLDKEEIKIEYGYTNSETGEFVEFETPIYDSEGLIQKYVALMQDYRNTQTVRGAMANDMRDKMQEAIQKRYDEALLNNEELTTDTPSQTETQQSLQRAIEKSKALVQLMQDNPNFSEEVKTQQQHIKESEIFLNDSGNGKFDRPAMQLTGNCWLLGGINALISTDFGREFLERNIIKDEEKHIFAVHLQEAEDRHLPKPNGDGIYVFSEKEIMDAQNMDSGLASGEGDAAAFALAIERYFKERNNENLAEGKENFTDGNTDYRLFEVVTGLSKRDFEHSNSGIQYKQATDIGNGETKLDYFDEVYQIAQNQSGAITVGIKGHEFSVVGTDGDYLLIQESNNAGSHKDKFELIENSFPPTYKVSKEVFEKTFISFAALIWAK